jgi:hypothetical protein
MLRFPLLLAIAVPVQSLWRRHNGSVARMHHNVTAVHNMTQSQIKQLPSASTFTDWYWGHKSGRGIWKWENALKAYQLHFAPLAAAVPQIKLAEIGVQSGGSLLMWKAVLGPATLLYGLDINPACQNFADASTTITIGDQADPNMWASFFATRTPTLDILIDDGGHTAEQMRNTLYYTYAHINPGGFVAIEDIHGRDYVESFFVPAAGYIGNWHSQGLVESVHLYPFLVMVKKAGGPVVSVRPEPALTVQEFPALWAALAGNGGKTIAVRNPGWGSFLAEPALSGIFRQFGPLHDYSYYDVPTGCALTAAAVCANYINNGNAQATIEGVDIYHDEFLVHVAATPPVI